MRCAYILFNSVPAAVFWHIYLIKKELLISAAALVVAFTPAAAAAQPVLKAQEKVTLALQWLTQCQFAGFYVALEKGYYREEGIDLTIRPGASDSNPVQLVSLGAAEFGTRWLADLIGAVDKGSPVVSIAQLLQSNGMVLIAHTDSKIRHPRDFVGKRVGIWFFGNQIQFYTLMSQSGVDVNKVKVSPMQFSVKPFLNRQYDVINTMTYNELLTVLQTLKREQLRVFDFADYGLNFPGDVLFTRRALLKDRPELVRRMVKASLRGWRDAVDDPEAAVRIVMKHDRTGTLELEHQRAQMKEVARLVRVGNRVLGTHVAEEVDRVSAILAKNKLISRQLKADEVVTNAMLP
jgi:NitT/TauT family transport system substrate-binding protein